VWIRAAVVAALVGLAGCTPDRPWGEVTETDRHRHGVLRADPVFGAIGVPVTGRAGETRDWLLARGEVSAEITGLADPVKFRETGLRVAGEARRAGWTVYRTECVGGQADGPPLLWTAWAYKIIDGVSYLLRIAAVTSSSTYPVVGDGAVQVDGYAPHSAERSPDLIPEHPAAVTPSCIDAPTVPASTTVQGLDVVFGATVNRDAPPEVGAPSR
jgi:hypothetical protein